MNYGEAFWHRSHQYQGVRICHIHNTWLYATKKYRLNCSCSHLGTPNLETVWESRIPLISQDTYSLHNAYAHKVHALLNKNIGYIDRRSISKLYLSRINKKASRNLCTHGNGEFISGLKSCLGSEFIHHINCGKSLGTFELWLSYFFSESDRFCHPVYHIIMLMFLGIRVDELAPLAHVNKPVAENSSLHCATE